MFYLAGQSGKASWKEKPFGFTLVRVRCRSLIAVYQNGSAQVEEASLGRPPVGTSAGY